MEKKTKLINKNKKSKWGNVASYRELFLRIPAKRSMTQQKNSKRKIHRKKTLKPMNRCITTLIREVQITVGFI